MSAVKLKLNFEAMQILMGELQPSQIQAIYFIGQDQEAPDTVTNPGYLQNIGLDRNSKLLKRNSCANRSG